MPQPETDNLNQKAVLYIFAGKDRDGEDSVNAGVEISCRILKGVHDSTGPDGGTIRLDGTVQVDREITVGSLLWLGKLADLPSPVTNLVEVVDYSETPDLKGRYFFRSVSYQKYAGALPSIV